MNPRTPPPPTAHDRDPDLFARRHHARFHDPTVPYHVISKLFQGLCLLVPTKELNDILLGVIARAQARWPDVKLYAYAILSNHLHLMLQGHPQQLPHFIGFIKREITRRCAPLVGWSGDTMWSRAYVSTALPTAEAQLHCLRYILGQGVKEGLVERPEAWPGPHCAHHFWGEGPVSGVWLDGTRYGKALYKERLKPAERRRPVDKARYTTRYTVRLDRLPVWAGLSEEEVASELEVMRSEVVEEGIRLRGGRRALGVAGVMRQERRRARPVPRPPWWEGRRRMVCWSKPGSAETRAYVERYWSFQWAFREASKAYLGGDETVEFPEGAFKPPVYGARSRAGPMRAA